MIANCTERAVAECSWNWCTCFTSVRKGCKRDFCKKHAHSTGTRDMCTDCGPKLGRDICLSYTHDIYICLSILAVIGGVVFFFYACIIEDECW